jgi:hypothetical protein
MPLVLSQPLGLDGASPSVLRTASLLVHRVGLEYARGCNEDGVGSPCGASRTTGQVGAVPAQVVEEGARDDPRSASGRAQRRPWLG